MCLDRGSKVCDPNGYAVFGKVLTGAPGAASGTALIDALGSVATTNAGSLANVPVNEILILGAVRVP